MVVNPSQFDWSQMEIVKNTIHVIVKINDNNDGDFFVFTQKLPIEAFGVKVKVYPVNEWDDIYVVLESLMKPCPSLDLDEHFGTAGHANRLLLLCPTLADDECGKMLEHLSLCQICTGSDLLSRHLGQEHAALLAGACHQKG